MKIRQKAKAFPNSWSWSVKVFSSYSLDRAKVLSRAGKKNYWLAVIKIPYLPWSFDRWAEKIAPAVKK